jgi:hypothetical protein
MQQHETSTHPSNSDEALVGAPRTGLSKRTIALMAGAGALGCIVLLPLAANAEDGKKIWQDSQTKIDRLIHNQPAPPTTWNCPGCGMG